MAASATTIIEHVVLFKVRDSTDPSKIDFAISGLRSLASLDVVSHLSVGPILRHCSEAAHAAGFTHFLHSRFRSKADLDAYSADPTHLAVVKDQVIPVSEDILVFDWVANIDGATVLPPGPAVRLALAKPKEEVAAAGILAAIQWDQGAVPIARQVTYGENFSPARGKGYSAGLLLVFPGVEELDALDSSEAVGAHEKKVLPLVESLFIVDFVFAAPPASSS